MILCFTLTMPRVNTWNGSWSGEDKQYTICRSFRTREMKEKAARILQKENYFYDFGDGWVASVGVKEQTRSRKDKKKICWLLWI